MKSKTQLICDIATIIIAIVIWIITDVTDATQFQKFVAYILTLNVCILVRIATTIDQRNKK